MSGEEKHPFYVADDIAPCHETISYGLEVLAAVKNYNRWVYDTFKNQLGRRIVEVGSGIGNITQFLTYREHVDCIEPHAEFMTQLKNQFGGLPNLAFHECTLENCSSDMIPPQSADTVLCMNVLEHLADDLGAVKKMASLLAPGGKLILFVPAMNMLYSDYDRKLGHYRRYSPENIRALFRNTCLDTITLRYVNIVGSFGWFIKFRLLKRTRMSRQAVLFYDRLIPALKLVERIVPPPIGQSLLGIAVRAFQT